MKLQVLQDTLVGGAWTGVGVGEFSPDLAEHLIRIGVARPYEAKIVEAPIEKKYEAVRPLSALPAVPASQPTTAPRRKGRPKSSQSTTPGA
jgi:hypothetical protein